MTPRILIATTVLFVALVSLSYGADNASAGPNSDPTYQQLRNLTLGGAAVSVNN